MHGSDVENIKWIVCEIGRVQTSVFIVDKSTKCESWRWQLPIKHCTNFSILIARRWVYMVSNLSPNESVLMHAWKSVLSTILSTIALSIPALVWNDLSKIKWTFLFCNILQIVFFCIVFKVCFQSMFLFLLMCILKYVIFVAIQLVSCYDDILINLE